MAYESPEDKILRVFRLMRTRVQRSTYSSFPDYNITICCSVHGERQKGTEFHLPGFHSSNKQMVCRQCVGELLPEIKPAIKEASKTLLCHACGTEVGPTNVCYYCDRPVCREHDNLGFCDECVSETGVKDGSLRGS